MSPAIVYPGAKLAVITEDGRYYIALDDVLNVLEAHRAILRAAGADQSAVEALAAELEWFRSARLLSQAD